MDKPLRRVPRRLYQVIGNKVVIGPHGDLRGACSGLYGDCTDLYGDCSGLSGDCTDLRGDCSGLSGNCTGLRGDCSGLYGDCDDIPQSDRPCDVADFVADERGKK